MLLPAYRIESIMNLLEMGLRFEAQRFRLTCAYFRTSTFREGKTNKVRNFSSTDAYKNLKERCEKQIEICFQRRVTRVSKQIFLFISTSFNPLYAKPGVIS